MADLFTIVRSTHPLTGQRLAEYSDGGELRLPEPCATHRELPYASENPYVTYPYVTRCRTCGYYITYLAAPRPRGGLRLLPIAQDAAGQERIARYHAAHGYGLAAQCAAAGLDAAR